MAEKATLRYKGKRQTEFGGDVFGESWTFDPSKKPKDGAENLLKLKPANARSLAAQSPDVWEIVNDPEQETTEQAVATEAAPQPVEQVVEVEQDINPATFGQLVTDETATGGDVQSWSPLSDLKPKKGR